jgi:hypothetical protein
MATKPVVGVKPDDYNEPFGAYNGWQLVVAASVCMGFSTIAVLLRIWTRRYVIGALGLDDWLCFAAWVSYHSTQFSRLSLTVHFRCVRPHYQ